MSLLVTEKQLMALDEQVTSEMLAGIIDHTLLYPFATIEDIQRLVQEGTEMGVASVCVNEDRVSVAQEHAYNLNKEEPIPISSVVAFPFGIVSAYKKCDSSRTVMGLGASEIDPVINIGLLKDGDLKRLKWDLQWIFRGAKEAPVPRRTNYGVKVILETCYLTPEEIRTGTRLVAEEAKNHPLARTYVKTSTGFGLPLKGPVDKTAVGATLEDVYLMKQTIDEVTQGEYVVGIKAAGGIGDRTTALQMMAVAGCLDDAYRLRENYQDLFRIGASATKKIIS